MNRLHHKSNHHYLQNTTRPGKLEDLGQPRRKGPKIKFGKNKASNIMFGLILLITICSKLFVLPVKNIYKWVLCSAVWILRHNVKSHTNKRNVHSISWNRRPFMKSYVPWWWSCTRRSAPHKSDEVGDLLIEALCIGMKLSNQKSLSLHCLPIQSTTVTLKCN